MRKLILLVGLVFFILGASAQDYKTVCSELPTHAKGDGMGFGFHRVCFVAKV